MDPFTLSLILGGIGLLAGGAGGLSAAGERERQLRDQRRMLSAQYDAAQAEQEAHKSILEGNLSVSTIDSNAAKKQAAMQAAAAEGEARAAAGTSGASGGTPFYALDKQMFANQGAVNDVNYRANMGLGQQQTQYTAAMKGMQGQLLPMEIAAQGLNRDFDYASSPLAYGMQALTGAASGASTGVNMASMATQAFNLKEKTIKQPTEKSPLGISQPGNNFSGMQTYEPGIPMFQVPNFLQDQKKYKIPTLMGV